MEPDASRARWALAILAALLVNLFAYSLAPIGVNTLISTIVATLPGILVAGLVVRARTVRRWVTVAVLVYGAALAVSVALLLLFPGGL